MSEKVIVSTFEGAHSTRTVYEDGTIEFITHYDKLLNEITELGAPVFLNPDDSMPEQVSSESGSDKVAEEVVEKPKLRRGRKKKEV
jgi:PDZ domain-containing secreted protein